MPQSVVLQMDTKWLSLWLHILGSCKINTQELRSQALARQQSILIAANQEISMIFSNLAHKRAVFHAREQHKIPARDAQFTITLKSGLFNLLMHSRAAQSVDCSASKLIKLHEGICSPSANLLAYTERANCGNGRAHRTEHAEHAGL